MGPRIQEDEPGQVHGSSRLLEGQAVKSAAYGVDAEDVESAVPDERREADDRVQQSLDARPQLTDREPRLPSWSGRCRGGPGQIEQVCLLGVVQLQRPNYGVHHRLRCPGEVASL